jgi:hypothetical protein
VFLDVQRNLLRLAGVLRQSFYCCARRQHEKAVLLSARPLINNQSEKRHKATNEWVGWMKRTTCVAINKAEVV